MTRGADDAPSAAFALPGAAATGDAVAEDPLGRIGFFARRFAATVAHRPKP